MKIGIPKEIKPQENRVSLTPYLVRELKDEGHEIFVEKNAGIGSGFTDKEYESEGATILDSHAKVFQSADFIVKVKEPLQSEFSLFHKDQILFTYLHLASDAELIKSLLKLNIIGIAYETVNENGKLPLLAPMSVIAGRMAPIMGAFYLMKHKGGNGVLIGGASGIPRGTVTIIGGGVAGYVAATTAAGMGANVTIFEVNPQRISYLEDILPKNVSVLRSNKSLIKASVIQSDIVIGAVLIPGAKAPKIVSEDLVKQMKPGSVIIDIAIDQGGSIETSHPTTHENPTYVVHDVIHYCVANMPAAYPRSSTIALTSATIPYIHAIANAERNWKELFTKNEPLQKGVNIFHDHLTCDAVAESFDMQYDYILDLLK
jgi:alanine dehydrogenase